MNIRIIYQVFTLNFTGFIGVLSNEKNDETKLVVITTVRRIQYQIQDIHRYTAQTTQIIDQSSAIGSSRTP